MTDRPRKAGKSRTATLGALTQSVLGPALKRRGFAAGDILAHWPQIIGPRLAEATLPEKIVWPRRVSELGDEADSEPATLHIRVDGPLAIEVQHMATQIIERVNVYFGYRAIGKLRIVQAPLPKPEKAANRPVADPATAERVKQSVSEVAHDGLREALTNLGVNVAADRRRINKP